MSRDITKLHPFTKMLADELVRRCAKKGLKIKITDCVRTKEEQNGINASRTNARYPFSYHNWGMAFDFCRNDGTGAYNEAGSFFYKVGEIGADLGLEWGGYWISPVDKPHFQFDGYTGNQNRVTDLIKKYIVPEKLFPSDDFVVKTPKLDITPKSSFKKILWLQVRLNIHGIKTDMDGIWGAKTTESVKKYWLKTTGNKCKGNRVSVRCIGMLAKDPTD